METITLYRPVGEKEMILIINNDYMAFPPRLDWQPIFYPVLNYEYACEIASKWNTNDEFGNYLGFVTKFKVTKEEYSKFKVEQVGNDIHKELWVPAEKLNDFNASIINEIEVKKVFVGESFVATTNDEIKTIIKKVS